MAKISDMQGAVNTGKQIGKIVSSLLDVLTNVSDDFINNVEKENKTQSNKK